MLRIGMAVYLMLATTAGPWLCCCTANSLAAVVAASLPKRTAAESAPAAVCCCCHHQEARPEKPADHAPAPRRSCPCNENRLPFAVAAAAGWPSTAQPEANLQPLCLSHDLLKPRGSLADALDNGRDGPVTPFRDGRAILCALHILRC
jgi:hypothetical protein